MKHSATRLLQEAASPDRTYTIMWTRSQQVRHIVIKAALDMQAAQNVGANRHMCSAGVHSNRPKFVKL